MRVLKGSAIDRRSRACARRRAALTCSSTSPAAWRSTSRHPLEETKAKVPPSAELAAGQARTFAVQAALVLANRGGLITRLNADGLKVDGVSYTAGQASNPGWTLTF
jgi:hypothetical protein